MERQVGKKSHCFPILRWLAQEHQGAAPFGLQTSPWEILWGLRPLSAPSSPQFDHLLTLQGSEPSQPLSSESLAFFPFIPSTNIYQ